MATDRQTDRHCHCLKLSWHYVQFNNCFDTVHRQLRRCTQQTPTYNSRAFEHRNNTGCEYIGQNAACHWTDLEGRLDTRQQTPADDSFSCLLHSHAVNTTQQCTHLHVHTTQQHVQHTFTGVFTPCNCWLIDWLSSVLRPLQHQWYNSPKIKTVSVQETTG